MPHTPDLADSTHANGTNRVYVFILLIAFVLMSFVAVLGTMSSLAIGFSMGIETQKEASEFTGSYHYDDYSPVSTQSNFSFLTEDDYGFDYGYDDNHSLIPGEDDVTFEELYAPSPYAPSSK